MAETCYVPLYLPASFKGVSFEAEEAGSEHGRRGAQGEFPFSENTAYADLGRKIRVYTLKGRYMTNNHIATASALIAACESSGPGLLVHPTRGPITVTCTKLSVTDNIFEEQGVTYFDMEFVEANTIATGLSIGSSLFGLSTTALFGSIGLSFELNYDMAAVQYFLVPEVLQTTANALDSIRFEFEKAIVGTDDFAKWAALSSMQISVSDPSSLWYAKNTFRTLRQSMTTLANNSTQAKKYESFKTIANKMAQVSPLSEFAGAAENVVYGSVRLMAVTYMVKAALEMPVTTINAALNSYDEIVSIIDEELVAARVTCDSNLHLELSNFASSAKAALLKRAYDLPALIEYNFNASVHSLVAAHEIFGDARKFKEIEDRNQYAFPFAMGPSIIATRV